MGLRYFGFYLGLLLHFYLQAFQKFAWGAQCAKTLQKVQKLVFETKIFFQLFFFNLHHSSISKYDRKKKFKKKLFFDYF